MTLRLLACLALLAPSLSAQTPALAAQPHIQRLAPGLDSLIAPNAVPERVATGFGFTEGPLWRHGRLWFVDGPQNKVRAVTPDGVVTEIISAQTGFAPYAGNSGPNGMAPAPDGSVVMCEQDGRRVVRLTGPDDHVTVTTLFDSFDGHRLNSPNDIVFAADGSFYFTDPPYGLPKMDADPAKELPFNGVFHFKDGRLSAVMRELTLPNGLALTADGHTLYVANSGPAMMYRSYPVLADGSLGAGSTLFTFQPSPERGIPDGMKLDSRGDLWITSPGGIRISTPDGRVLGQIKLPEVAANLAWGGPDGHDLYITASHSIYRVHTLVRGQMPLFADRQ